jgi:hypothetical protein
MAAAASADEYRFDAFDDGAERTQFWRFLCRFVKILVSDRE